MSTLDVTEDVPSNEVEASETEEPNITTTVEDVEEPAANEVAAEPEVAANETEPEVKSSDNDLENRVKELEGKLNELVKILQSTYTKYEYDDDKFRWTYDFLEAREAFNEL